MPMSKEIYNYRKHITKYVNGKKDLPRELYSKLHKLLKEYKSLKGIKPKLCVAHYKKSRINKKTKSKLHSSESRTKAISDNCKETITSDAVQH